MKFFFLLLWSKAWIFLKHWVRVRFFSDLNWSLHPLTKSNNFFLSQADFFKNENEQFIFKDRNKPKLSLIESILFKITVKPVHNDHPRDPKTVAVVGRWSLFGSHLCYKSIKWDLKMVAVVDRRSNILIISIVKKYLCLLRIWINNFSSGGGR